MKIGDDDELAAILRVADDEAMLLLSEYGFGKRVSFESFSSHGRGTGGQRIYGVTEKTGEIVGCVTAREKEEIMVATSQGKSIKLKVKEVRIMGVSAQGVKIVNIERPDFVVGVDRIVKEEEEDNAALKAETAPAGPQAAVTEDEDEPVPEDNGIVIEPVETDEDKDEDNGE